MRFIARDASGGTLSEYTCFSIGGGFVVDESDAAADQISRDETALPYPYRTGDDLLRMATRQFAELAEKFNNTVFEQSDSLKPAADLLKQTPRTSGWITRSGAPDAELNNPKVIQAIFSEDVRVNKRNTEAIEVGPGMIVAARVIEHKPSALQPFEQIKAAIDKKLVAQRASQLAAEEGRKQLEELRQGKAASRLVEHASAGEPR